MGVSEKNGSKFRSRKIWSQMGEVKYGYGEEFILARV